MIRKIIVFSLVLLVFPCTYAESIGIKIADSFPKKSYCHFAAYYGYSDYAGGLIASGWSSKRHHGDIYTKSRPGLKGVIISCNSDLKLKGVIISAPVPTVLPTGHILCLTSTNLLMISNQGEKVTFNGQNPTAISGCKRAPNISIVGGEQGAP